MKRKLIAFAVLALSLFSFQAYAADAPSTTAPAKAFCVNIKDNDTVQNPFKVIFGISGMKIAPAGTNEPGTGHFHLLIDTQLTDEQKKLPIPNDEQHKHFGKGQMETTLTLTPGKHTLQLVMGDGLHKLHNPPVMSDVITVTVKQ